MSDRQLFAPYGTLVPEAPAKRHVLARPWGRYKNLALCGRTFGWDEAEVRRRADATCRSCIRSYEARVAAREATT